MGWPECRVSMKLGQHHATRLDPRHAFNGGLSVMKFALSIIPAIIVGLLSAGAMAEDTIPTRLGTTAMGSWVSGTIPITTLRRRSMGVATCSWWRREGIIP